MKKIGLILLSILFVSQNSEYLQLQKKWISALNNKDNKNLQSFYLSSAGLYLSGNLDLISETRISELMNVVSSDENVDGYQETFMTEGRQGHVMTLGYIRQGEDLYANLSAWRKSESGFQKEFETLSKVMSGDIQFDLELFTSQRRNWEKYSNDHDPAGLINNVYTTDSYYLNGGRIDFGRTAIIERYAYMKRENWNIRLEAKGIIPVDQNVAYEIGKYYSTGEGQYLLIWEKQRKGEWQIKLDFNF